MNTINNKYYYFQTMSAPTPNQVRHFSLIPLHTAKTLEGLTGAFSEAVCSLNCFSSTENRYKLVSTT